MACELLVVECGIYFPDQGLNLGPAALGVWSLSHWTAWEESHETLFDIHHFEKFEFTKECTGIKIFTVSVSESV